VTILDHLRQQLHRDEGLRLMPYTDTVGKLTIGVGRNLTDRGISDDEAQYLLDNDIAICIGELRSAYPWFDRLDEARQGVLVNMCFNLGMPKLAKFGTTLGLVRTGKYPQAAVAMLQSKWAQQVGNRAVRLAEQMRDGVWV
jgi:lysozyme